MNIEQINRKINNFIWGPVMLVLLVRMGNIVGVTTAIVSGGAGAFVEKFVPIMCIFYIIVRLIIIIQLGRGFGVYSKFSSILFWYVR